MTDTHNTPETLETELNRLVLLLEAVESAWVYAVYDDVPTRDQLIATMRERLAPIAVLERSLAGSGETSPLEFAQQTPVLPNQSAPVICFTGLGNAIMQGHLPNLLDMHREALASTRHRLVFWVRENEWVALLETARNFSSRIAGSFDFREEAGESLGSEPRVEISSTNIFDKFSKDKTYKVLILQGIEGIQERIRQIDSTNPKSARELAHLHSNLGQKYQLLDRPRWLEAEAVHLQAARFFAVSGDIAAQAQELLNSGQSAYRANMYTLAHHHYQESLVLFRSLNNLLGQANAFMLIGDTSRLNRDFNQTLNFYDRSLSLYNKIGDLQGQANTLMRIGIVNKMQNKYEIALNYYSKAFYFYNKIYDRLGQANTLENIGDVKQNQGELENSLEIYGKALDLYNQIGDLLGRANALESIGTTKKMQGDTEKEILYYDQALNLYIQISDRSGQANVYMRIGDARKMQDEFEQALENYSQALNFYNETSDHLGQANIFFRIGDINKLQNNSDQAKKYHNKALILYEEIGDHLGQANVLQRIGDAKQNQGDLEQTLKNYNQALDLYNKVGDFLGQASTKSRLSQVELLQGNESKSKDLLHSALETLQNLGYRHDYAVAIGDYGLTLNRVGKLLQARPYLERATKLFETLNNPKLAQNYRNGLKRTPTLSQLRASLLARLQAWLSRPGNG